MRRKLEDQIVRLSFEDLGPEEAKAVFDQMANDPEAQRLMREYSAIRSELKMLKDVPEDQLSTERMRDAILAQGLKPKPAERSYGWLWAPVSVACLAFALASWRARQLEPMIPAAGVPNLALKKDRPEPIFTAPREQSPLAIKEQTRPEAAMKSQPSEVLASMEPAKHRGSSSWRHVATRRNERLAVIDTAMKQAVDTAASEPVAMIPPKNSLVLIANDSDDDTGAKKATEVDDSNNVLISG